MPLKPKIFDARSKPNPQSQSQAALRAMVEANVLPTPENYELWYHHVGNHMPALSKEVEDMNKQGVEFTDEVSHSLHEKYFSKASNNEEAVQGINDAMNKFMRMVGNFSTEAKAYNEKLGEQTDDLSSKIEGDDNLEGLLGEVVGQLQEIKQSGSDFGSKMKESQQEITELRQNLEKATTEARIDGLTSLNNRRAFDELMQEQVETATENKTELCLLMMDIDFFKDFNDTWGHQIGDEVLKIVSGVLRRTVRGKDIVCRYGGEEFAILLPETPARGAQIVAESIRSLIAKNRIRRKNSTEEIGQITLSIGVSRYHVSSADESIAAFIKRADNALYQAKEKGRNRVELAL
ncbi:MAG: diguanylate cyclase [Rickettsiales bacterium]|nr:diguanylate cyclase [Rickettsiales bacterium]